MKPVYFVCYEAVWHRRFLFIKWEKRKIFFDEITLNGAKNIDRISYLSDICSHITSHLKCDKIAIINYIFLREEVSDGQQ